MDPVKINAILRYLERSKSLEVDLDGNIIWMREEGGGKSNQSTLADVANISKDFLNYFSTKGEGDKEEKLK